MDSYTIFIKCSSIKEYTILAESSLAAELRAREYLTTRFSLDEGRDAMTDSPYTFVSATDEEEDYMDCELNHPDA